MRNTYNIGEIPVFLGCPDVDPMHSQKIVGADPSKIHMCETTYEINALESPFKKNTRNPV